MPEQVARLFYETYECLVQQYGCQTREASAVPWDQVPSPNRALMVAVAAEVIPHIRAAIYAELGNDHYVIFTEDRWTVEHSVECRLSGYMHECRYHAAVGCIAAEHDEDMAGRWKITGIDSGGLPSLEKAGQP